jgi:hypothetical protein
LRQIVAICILMIGVCLYLHTLLLRFAHHQMQQDLLSPDQEMLMWTAAESKRQAAEFKSGGADSGGPPTVEAPTTLLDIDPIDP